MQKLTKDLDLQQDKLTSLGAISKRLEQNCDATGPRDRLSKLNRKMFNLHSKASEKLNALEEVNDDIDDYEDELGRLRIWMDETRSHLTMRDTSLTLKEQLAVYEVSIQFLQFMANPLVLKEMGLSRSIPTFIL